MTSSPERPDLLPLPDRLSFGPFELRVNEHRLYEAGQPVALGGRAFDLLVALVQRADRLVPRNELIEAVWPGRVVEENNLSVQMNALRKVLGSAWLVTVPGRGYRFTGAEAAPPVPPPAARTHLPALPPLLVGRGEDLAALATLVDQHRLVTLAGAGGIGKTRLAQTLLALRARQHAQGVCWVELSGVTDAAALPGAVATALGVRPAPGGGAAALAEAMAGLQMLVALDNAEHLVDAVAALAQALLAGAPGLRLLVTSQAPLKLAEERVLRLPALAVPQGPLPAREAQAFGAVALFVDRAQAADHRFVLEDAEVPAVIALCRQLDGNALAIELAAARVSLLGMDALIAALPQRLALLTANRDRSAPVRQRTLRAALEWSHGLLAPHEQRLFMQLAVVAGSASLALVQALTDADADGWTVLDALDELVQRSLVEVMLADGGEPRYRLLESPRLLAGERLAASGEVAAVRQRHAGGVLRLFDEAELAMEGGHLGVEAWRRGAERELDNARDALAFAEACGERTLLLQLGSALLPALPPALHDERLALADRLEALLPGTGDAALRRRVQAALSTALANADPPRSRAAAWQALAAARELDAGDLARWHLYQALCEAADIVVDEAEASAAEALLAEAGRLEDPAWPPVRKRCGARVAAAIAAARGQAAEAMRISRELLRLSLAAGDPSPMTRINLVDTELWAGDARAAAATGTALIAWLEGQRDENHLAYARLNVAAAWLALGRSDEAEAQLRAAWPAARRVQRLSWWCDHAALLALLQDRPADAAHLVGAADARYAAAGERRQVNEAREHERTRTALTAALGAPALEASAAAGALLADDALPPLAFARGVCNIRPG